MPKEETDQSVIEDREEVYGPPRLFFESYGVMCGVMEEYARVGQGDSLNIAHLSAMKMVLLKLLRSCWCPDVEDNYVDGRNYISIAEMTLGDSECGEPPKTKMGLSDYLRSQAGGGTIDG